MLTWAPVWGISPAWNAVCWGKRTSGLYLHHLSLVAGHCNLHSLPLGQSTNEGKTACCWTTHYTFLNCNTSEKEIIQNHILKEIAQFFTLVWSLQAKLSILLATLLLACYCYLLMEHRLAKKVPYRLPRIPRPRHKVTNQTVSLVNTNTSWSWPHMQVTYGNLDPQSLKSYVWVNLATF